MSDMDKMMNSQVRTVDKGWSSRFWG